MDMADDLVDVIFLDIDGVLLPFGGSRDNFRPGGVALPCTEGCLFPDRTMDALTALLHRLHHLSVASAPAPPRCRPVLVLSSTWRARPEFVQDILSSFRAYVAGREEKRRLEDVAAGAWARHLACFYDMTNPTFHATRHDEIYKWVRDRGGAMRGDGEPPPRPCRMRSWIALDDEDIVHVEGRRSQDATEHAVQTKSAVGLTLHDVEVGVRLVKKQMREFHDRFPPNY